MWDGKKCAYAQPGKEKKDVGGAGGRVRTGVKRRE